MGRHLFCRLEGEETRRTACRVPGNSGTSEETAIVLAAPNRYQLLRAEYWYLYHRFGLNWQRGSQFRTVPDVDGMSYDILEVEMDGQPLRSVYFNVTIPAEPVDLSLDPRFTQIAALAAS